MDPNQLLSEHYQKIKKTIRSIASKYGIQESEMDDFEQHVFHCLLENDGKKLRAFAGKSSLLTFLHTVITRICIDQIRKERGRRKFPQNPNKIDSTTLKRNLKHPSFLEEPILLETAIPNSSPEVEFEQKRIVQVEKKIDQILTQMRTSLTTEERLILKLFEQGSSLSEIAKVLGQSRYHVEKQIRQILQQFKEKLLLSGINLHDLEEIFKKMQ